MSRSARVAVIALDAMDSGLALEMVASGDMPHLAALLDRSWSRPVSNPEGLLVGSVWPTYWCGCGPGQHGFYCFRQLDNGTYEVAPKQPSSIAIPPVWKVLSDAGRRCAVIDAPMSSLMPDIDGLQIVEWGAHDRIASRGASPQGLWTSMMQEFGDYPVDHCDRFVSRHDDDPVALRDALLAGADMKQRFVDQCLDDGPWDLFVVGQSECHCAGHHLWSLHDPSHPRHDVGLRAELGDPMVEVYRGVDAALGSYLERLADAEAVFVVLSHGMGPHYDGDHFLDEVLRRFDDRLFRAPRSRVNREHAMRYLGRGRRRRTHRIPLDGSRHFYRVPNNTLYGGIRINLKGREPRGVVAPGVDTDELIATLRREFQMLVDPESGRPIVRDLLRTSELHPGPALNDLPDLLVDWIRNEPLSGASSQTIGMVHAPYIGARTGDHRPTGLLIACGPNIEPNRGSTSIRSVDLAPTVAALLDVELPGVEGSPIADLIGSQR